jgi:hypothetical protein
VPDDGTEFQWQEHHVEVETGNLAIFLNDVSQDL